MIRKVLTTFVTLVVIMVTAKAHDLFLKLNSYLLQPNSKAIVRVLNGTFQNSDGAVARERLANLSLYGPGLTASSAESIVWRAEDQ